MIRKFLCRIFGHDVGHGRKEILRSYNNGSKYVRYRRFYVCKFCKKEIPGTEWND